MKTIFKIILLVSIGWLQLNATIQKVNENYIIIQTAGDTYMGNELDQTYSLNPFLMGAGESIIILDNGGTNTIELVAGLTITSSIVASNEIILYFNNGASVDIRDANTFTFDVGANSVDNVTGTQQNFATFVTSTLGLDRVPTQGEPVVNGGAIDAIVAGGEVPDRTTTELEIVKTQGYLIDSALQGVTYICDDDDGSEGWLTDEQGMFECANPPVTFKIGNLTIGTLWSFTGDKKVFPQDLLGLHRRDFSSPDLKLLARFMQSLDDNGDISTTIKITEDIRSFFKTEQNFEDLSEDDVKDFLDKLGKKFVSECSAMRHLGDSSATCEKDVTPPTPTPSSTPE